MLVEELIKSGIGAVIGAVIGLGITLFLNRRKTELSVLSVVPSGKSFIKGYSASLGGELLTNLKEFQWTLLARLKNRDFTETEDLIYIYKEAQNARAFKKASPSAQEVIVKALHAFQHKESLTKERQKEVIAALVSNPLVSSLLRNMTLYSQLTWTASQTKTENDQLLIPLSPLSDPNTGYALYFEGFAYYFEYHDEHAQKVLESLANSLAKPHIEELIENLRVMEGSLLEDLTRAEKIMELGEDLINKNSRWVISLQVTNRGASTIVLSPKATLEAKYGQKSYGPINIRVYSGPGSSPESTSIQRDPLVSLDIIEDTIKSFGTAALEPQEHQIFENIVVSPNSAKSLFLVSDEKIGENQDGKRLISLSEQGLVAFRVALTMRPKRMLWPRVVSDWA
jgi:hypothetical protein